MIVAFYCCHPAHLRLGNLAAASVRKHMPHAKIVHLTDCKTDALEDADRVMRFSTEGNFWKRSWTAAASLDGDIILAGTDTLFQRDVTEVFDRDFDVALPHIADVRLDYDAGTQFVRGPAFFRHLLNSPFCEAEMSVTGFLEEFQRCARTFKGKLIELPGKIYSHVPLTQDNPDVMAAALVHYRGPRKRWMLPDWKLEGAAWN